MIIITRDVTHPLGGGSLEPNPVGMLFPIACLWLCIKTTSRTLAQVSRFLHSSSFSLTPNSAKGHSFKTKVNPDCINGKLHDILFSFIMLNWFYLLKFLFAAEMELDKGQQKPTCDRKNRFATLILAVDLINKSNPPVKFLLFLN